MTIECLPDLLASYYNVLRDQKDSGIVYCDEDKIDGLGRHRETYFKPDWSPEHLLSCMYILHCLCVRKSLFLQLGGYRPAFDGAQDYDFVLRAAAAGATIRHVDQLMYHWRMGSNSAASSSSNKSFAIETGRLAVSDHLSRIGVNGKVENGIIPGTYRVRPRLDPDRVALNILTACTPCSPMAQLPDRPTLNDLAAGNDADLGHASPTANVSGTYLENFVRSILAHPPALDFEIRVIVDRHAEAIATPLADLDPRLTIVPFDKTGSYFNFAEKSNFAIRGCTADRMILLNDDMEAIDDEWLPALLEMLELPGVGVVGGRLLYETTRPALRHSIGCPRADRSSLPWHGL